MDNVFKVQDSPFLDLDGRDCGREFRSWLAESSNTFKGYNFEGSGITAITDVFGQYMMQDAFIANMAYNESNVLRSNVWINKASISSARGYTPHTKLGARTIVTITMNSDSIQIFNKMDHVFVGYKNNEHLPFVLIEDQKSQFKDTKQVIHAEIVQGSWETFSFDVNDPGFSRYTIEDEEIDISTLNVYVYASNTTLTGVKYERILHLNDISRAGYFIILDSDGKYSLIFGDDKMAKRPKMGSTIFIEYVKTKGSVANDINKFTLGLDPDGVDGSAVTADFKSYGGSDLESLNSIEMNSIINSSFVSAETYYYGILKTKYPQISDIVVVDGEHSQPVRYGVVYIYASITGQPLLNKMKEQIHGVLKQYQLNPTIFKVLDAKVVDINVNINIALPDVHRRELIDSVKSTIYDFDTEFHNKISSSFYPTELTKYVIDKTGVKIIDTSFGYKVALSSGNPGVKSMYTVELPFNLNVDKIELYTNNSDVPASTIDLKVDNASHKNGFLEYFRSANHVQLSNITRSQNDYLMIYSDDDASYIEKTSYWIPHIDTVNVSINRNNTNTDICI